MANTVKVNVTGDSKGLTKAAENANKGFKKMEKSAKRTSSSMTSAFGKAKSSLIAMGPALAGIVTGFLSVRSAAQYFGGFVRTLGDELGKFHTQTGINVSTLDKLRQMADLSGVSFNELKSSIKLTLRGIGDAVMGTGEAKNAFEQLGLSLDDLTSLSPDEQFLTLAEALSKVDDAALRTSLGSKIMGRSFLTLVPLIQNIREGLKNTSSAWSNEAARNVEAFNDHIATLKENLQANLLPIANEVVKVFNRMFGGFEDPIKDTNLAITVLQKKLRDLNYSAIDPARKEAIKKALMEQLDIQYKQLDAEYAKLGINKKQVDELAKLKEELAAAQKSLTGNQFAIAQGITIDTSAAEKNIENLKNQIKTLETAIEEGKRKAKEEEKNKSKKTTTTSISALTKEQEALLKKQNILRSLKEITNADQIANEENQQLINDLDEANVNTLLKKSNLLREQRDLINGITNADMIQYEANEENVDAMQNKLTVSQQLSKDLQMKLKQNWADTIAGTSESFGTALGDMVSGARTATNAIRDMFRALAQEAGQAFAKWIAVKAVTSSANGNVFEGGEKVTAFANGGIVSKPTMVPMAKMGEEGPEAIFPLTRKQGKLSLTGPTGGQNVVQVTNNINISAVDARSFLELVRANPQAILAPINEAVNRGDYGFTNAIKNAARR